MPAVDSGATRPPCACSRFFRLWGRDTRWRLRARDAHAVAVRSVDARRSRRSDPRRHPGPRAREDVPDGRGRGAGASRRGLRSPQARAGRPPRAVRKRQVHAPQHPRRSRRADLRDACLRGARSLASDRGRAHPVPALAHRLHLPVLQPDPQPHGARERGARRGHRRQAHVARRGAGPRRAVCAARPLPVPDVGRRAAAGRDRARRREAARDPLVRRADGRPRRGDGAAGPRGARPGQPRLGTSIAVVTHNAPIAQMADRVVSLADGRIASDRANPDRKAPSEVSW